MTEKEGIETIAKAGGIIYTLVEAAEAMFKDAAYYPLEEKYYRKWVAFPFEKRMELSRAVNAAKEFLNPKE